MRDFDYLMPETVGEVSGLLARLGDDCRMIAGGTALLLALRQRMVTPTHLVSLARVRGLRGITYDPRDGLRIGALTTHAAVARSPLVRQRYPVLADMASRLANPQVRNQGTLGGNLCYADPTTDPPTCLAALEAMLVLGSARGYRYLPVTDFLVDYYASALEPDEVLTEIRIPAPRFDFGYHARFHRTAAEHRPLINLALLARRDGDVVGEARLVVGATTVVPTRVAAAEAVLAGRRVTAALAREAADIVAEAIDPVSDIRGGSAFRRDMVRVVARRTIERLVEQDSEGRIVA
ncbi:FAD binding domain-containing protein [Roseomonas populi]|uniref:Xanthine dehydrogenase family protein subunit M n=1 Tax=Roseomonas populi TaxID=3121582 RepID=A0ABT1X4P5_9PROT|nr:xanthine dehydrogenase family protein subunit M [Roseomonas pecuniae]MCR0982689.1 xanthine dehydrogenase family protein subunit M [Roseomonas pecuniae]